MKVIVAIPCLNEERFISDIVLKSKKYSDEVIVVDDGSTDNTSSVAKNAGAEVLRHESRQGPGAAIRSGFQAAIAENVDILVTIDGDGQHNPEEIPVLIQTMISENADLVIGSRFLVHPCEIKFYRRFGIDIINFAYNIGSKVKITDSQSGFRAYSKKFLQTVKINENNFGFSVETLVKARNQGLIIKEAPISCIYHDQGSSLNPVAHGFHVTWSVFKFRFREKYCKDGKMA
jgi:glycosyltransferase involved in cell wall biosynthesis